MQSTFCVNFAGRPQNPVNNPTVDQRPARAYMSRMNLGTWLFTLLNGNLVGTDPMGNRYYQERAIRPNGRSRR